MTEQVKLEEYSIAQLNNICGNPVSYTHLTLPTIA